MDPTKKPEMKKRVIRRGVSSPALLPDTRSDRTLPMHAAIPEDEGATSRVYEMVNPKAMTPEEKFKALTMGTTEARRRQVQGDTGEYQNISDARRLAHGYVGSKATRAALQAEADEFSRRMNPGSPAAGSPVSPQTPVKDDPLGESLDPTYVNRSDVESMIGSPVGKQEFRPAPPPRLQSRDRGLLTPTTSPLKREDSIEYQDPGVHPRVKMQQARYDAGEVTPDQIAKMREQSREAFSPQRRVSAPDVFATPTGISSMNQPRGLAAQITAGDEWDDDFDADKGQYVSSDSLVKEMKDLKFK